MSISIRNQIPIIKSLVNLITKDNECHYFRRNRIPRDIHFSSNVHSRIHGPTLIPSGNIHFPTNVRSRTYSPTIIPDGKQTIVVGLTVQPSFRMETSFFSPSNHRSQILGPTTIPDGNIFFPSSDHSRIHGPTTTLIGNILSAFKQPVIKQTCYQKNKVDSTK